MFLIKGTGNPISNFKIDKHGILKKDKTIPGQSHHLNQDAVYKSVIPTNEGMAVKLKGNAFTEIDSQHYSAHKQLEKFWDQYRRGGEKYREMPTNLEYTKAMKDSFKKVDLTDQEVMEAIIKAIKQRVGS